MNTKNLLFRLRYVFILMMHSGFLWAMEESRLPEFLHTITNVDKKMSLLDMTIDEQMQLKVLFTQQKNTNLLYTISIDQKTELPPLNTEATAIAIDDNNNSIIGTQTGFIKKKKLSKKRSESQDKEIEAHNTKVQQLKADKHFIISQSEFDNSRAFLAKDMNIRFWLNNFKQEQSHKLFKANYLKEISSAFLLGYKDGTALWAKKSLTGSALTIYVGFNFEKQEDDFQKKPYYDFTETKELFSIPFFRQYPSWYSYPLPACYVAKDKIIVFNDTLKQIVEVSYVNSKIKQIAVDFFNTRKTEAPTKDVLYKRNLTYKVPLQIEDIDDLLMLLVYDDRFVFFSKGIDNNQRRRVCEIQNTIHVLNSKELIVKAIRHNDTLYFATIYYGSKYVPRERERSSFESFEYLAGSMSAVYRFYRMKLSDKKLKRTQYSQSYQEEELEEE